MHHQQKTRTATTTTLWRRLCGCVAVVLLLSFADGAGAADSVEVFRAGVRLDEANPAATQTMKIRLNSQPTAGQVVVIDLSSDTTKGASLSQSQLTFTNADWNVYQFVTIVAVDDAILEAAVHSSLITLKINQALTTFSVYDSVTIPQELVYIADNDRPTIAFRTGPPADEANTAATQILHVGITQQPTAGQEVVIDLNSDTVQGVTLASNQLTFTNANWNTLQDVVVTTVDDAVLEAPTHPSVITLTINQGLTTYNAYDSVIIPSETMYIIDNDKPVSVVRAGVPLEEGNAGATQTLRVRLTSQPTAGQVVVIELGSDTSQGATLSQTQLTFTNANWNSYQNVTITAVDDVALEPATHSSLITLTINQALTTFNSYDSVIIPSELVYIIDNDKPVSVLRLGSPLDEGNLMAMQTLRVRLAQQPTAGQVVVIDLSSDTVQGVTLSQATLTFTETDWNLYHDVTITTVDDAVLEAPTYASTITLTVNAGETTFDTFDTVLIPDETVYIIDNDKPVSVVRVGTPLDEANLASTQTLRVRLTQPPAAGMVVVIDLSSDTVQGVTLSQSTLTFTDTDWNSYQDVKLTTVDDTVIEAASHASVVTLMINQGATTDDSFDALVIPAETVYIKDNDFTFSVTPNTLAFSGMRLGSAPGSQTSDIAETSGSGAVNWTAVSDQRWLSVTPTSGSFTTGTATLTVQANQHVSDRWTTLTTTTGAPEGRQFSTAVWTGTEMVVWGGQGPSGTPELDTGGRYNPTTNSWGTALSTTNAPSARHGHVAVWTGTKMIVWGGFTLDAFSEVQDGGIYDPATDTWTTMSTFNAPAARQDACAVWTGTEMLVICGWNGSGYVYDGGRYDPATDTWAIGGMPTTYGPTGRRGASAVWTGTEMMVWGGFSGGPLNTGARFNVAKNAWLQTAISTTGAPTHRANHSAVWTGQDMVVWGGAAYGVKSNTGACYNPVSNTWHDPTNTADAPSARISQVAVFTGTEMIVWGGEDPDYLNDGKRWLPPYDLSGGLHTGKITVSDPVALNNPQVIDVNLTVTQPTIVLTPNSLAFTSTIGSADPGAQNSDLTNGGPANTTLNWKAQSNDNWLAVDTTAGSLDTVTTQPLSISVKRATPTWTGSLATSGAPAARYGCTAVWTGTKMIVWGGYSSGSTKTGGIYDPATDTWTAMTSNGAPSARLVHTAIWTGSKMIVWGGGTTPVNTGGIYDPAADAWTSMSTTNAPAARRNHTAVWTGTEMIVWGGSLTSTGSTLTNTGARYDAATDTWSTTATSTTNAPSARRYHVAVWTGTEMVVWGGNTNSGGRYNPSTNTWVNYIGTVNYPTNNLQGASAVWTGTEMLMWGGTGGSVSNSGGAYNPTTDTWTAPFPTWANADPRMFHCAVWTGKEMLVWGGWDSDYAIVGDGHRFDPSFALAAGVHHGTITVSDPNASNNSQTLGVDITVVQPLAIDTASLPNAVETVLYSATVNAIGGTAPYTWAATGLPNGLSIDQDTGEIGGTPTENGSYNVSVTVTDDVAATDNRNITLNVDTPPPVIHLNPASLTFSATDGGSDPASQTVDLTNTGPATSTLNWTASSNQPWLSVSPAGGTTTSETDVLTISPVLTVGDAWTTATSLSNLPIARQGHSAIWTGTEMIIWGGAGAGPLPARYLRSNDWWLTATVATTGAPTSRSLHTAVWSGSKMIIWGGGGAAASNGGIYDYASNTWSTVATADAPSARQGAIAVWTGTEMIVWGGYNGTTLAYLNDGVRYNPSTDTWSTTLLSTTGAPSARRYACAVWTGTEMIVWGGNNGSTYYSDGARYDPATDQWSSMATVNAPTGRSQTAAVWTGSRMIVWGGNASGTRSNTGGIYDPATDTWRGSTTTTNAPTGRYGHSAVWTGTEMLIWGGFDTTLANVSTGMGYKPGVDLTPGTYNGTITVSDPNAINNPQTIAVSFTVDP